MKASGVVVEEQVCSDDSLTVSAAVDLASVDPIPDLIEDAFVQIVDAVAAVDRTIAALTAARAELVDEARQWSELSVAAAAPSSRDGWTPERVARRELVTELACALRLPERAAENLIEQSHSLLHELPETMQALRLGTISLRHAQVMIDNADSLPPESRASFEVAALPFALTLTVARFSVKARALRERLHPDSIDDRIATSADNREFRLEPARDGMAWLSAYLPAIRAEAIFNRVTDIALGLRDGDSDETRTLTQLRVDVFSDLLIQGTTDAAHASLGNGIVARVLVTVPALALLGRSVEGGTNEQAVLEGYGPIDIETARELAAGAPSFIRLLTHPETGAVLSVGRDRYAVPNDLRTWLRVRDGTCRYPGCGQGARRCDIDHTVDWQFGSSTEHGNLAHLCPKHHQLKHHTGWKVIQVGNGVLEWTSPLGRAYRTDPESRMPDSRMPDHLMPDHLMPDHRMPAA